MSLSVRRLVASRAERRRHGAMRRWKRWPESTFAPCAREHGHGAHFAPFLDDPLELASCLPEILPHRLAQRGREPPRALPPGWAEADLWAWPLRVQGLQLVVERFAESPVSIFPFFATGSRARVVLDEVRIWEGGLEAQLRVSWGDAAITFFDTRYLLNRSFYEAGATYEIVLTGIAYEAAPWVATETFGLRGLAALLPAGGDADDYVFRGTIRHVSAVRDWLGQDGWKLRTTVMRFDDDVEAELDIVVTARAWKAAAKPRIGLEIEGRLWLQGYVAAL